MSFFILLFDVVVAVVLVILAVATHFDAYQFLGYICNLHGETAAGIVPGVDILLVGVVYFCRRRWVGFVFILLRTYFCFHVAPIFNIGYCVKSLGLRLNQ